MSDDELAKAVNEVLGDKVLGSNADLICAMEAMHEACHVFDLTEMHDSYNAMVDRLHAVAPDQGAARQILAEWIEGATHAVQQHIVEAGQARAQFWCMHKVPYPGFIRWEIRAEGTGIQPTGL